MWWSATATTGTKICLWTTIVHPTSIAWTFGPAGAMPQLPAQIAPTDHFLSMPLQRGKTMSAPL